MLFENIVFGPIHSRRLGTSLGVNVLPTEKKYCSFNCIYCECGWNVVDTRVNVPFNKREDIRAALEHRLSVNTEAEKAGEGRIAVNGKAAADSLSLIDEKKKEEEQWMKTEYVPVTSFIHTMKYDNYRRIYQAYQTPADFYKNTFDNVGIVSGDSILDKTSHYRLQNTFAVSLLEGFNKWANV